MLRTTAITIGERRLRGELCTVKGSRGLVVFVHGSGSSRLSRRSTRLAETLQRQPFDTLLFDLLAADEGQDTAASFNLPLQAARVRDAMDAARAELGPQSVGLFGADTGAAVAMAAAAQWPQRVQAIVARGGRLELAGDLLRQVRAPTLLIVGAADISVLQTNRQAHAALGCEKRIELVPRATHLFQEAGAIEAVALMASQWFLSHLLPPAAPAAR